MNLFTACYDKAEYFVVSGFFYEKTSASEVVLTCEPFAIDTEL
ncbi:hypothetical protein [Pseudobacteroides cellulosolvens]|nr:hypothetical protein [Pseudobacteroides cellulosolvens]